MRSGNARKSGKAKAGGGGSHPHTHALPFTRFYPGRRGAFAVPTRSAPAGVRALRPLNVTPAAPVRGRLRLGMRGVKLHLGPPPSSPSSAPGPLCLSRGCKWSGGSRGTRVPSSSRPQARGAGLRSPRTAARARPGGGVLRGGGRAAADAVDITAESLRRCPAAGATRAPLNLLTSHPGPKLASGQDSGGGGEKGGWKGGKVVPSSAPLQSR